MIPNEIPRLPPDRRKVAVQKCILIFATFLSNVHLACPHTSLENAYKYCIFNSKIEKQKIKRSQLKHGDHIFVPGSQSRGLKMKGLVGYYHHAVYLKIDGKDMVSDFGAVKNKMRPVIRPLDEFLNYSDKLYRQNYGFETLSPEVILKNARSICDGKGHWQSYNLFFNNCEHYASLLKMGQVYSMQAMLSPYALLVRFFVQENKGHDILKLHTDEDISNTLPFTFTQHSNKPSMVPTY